MKSDGHEYMPVKIDDSFNCTDLKQLSRNLTKVSFIYALVDPRVPKLIRYVGQAENPRVRHIQHCCEGGISLKCKWIESMRLYGVLPQMLILEETTPALADSRELRWIKRLRTSELVNTARVPAAQCEPMAIDTYGRLTTLEEQERQLIMGMMHECDGNKLETAKRLGIGRQTLYNKLHKYALNGGQVKKD